MITLTMIMNFRRYLLFTEVWGNPGWRTVDYRLFVIMDILPRRMTSLPLFSESGREQSLGADAV